MSTVNAESEQNLAVIHEEKSQIEVSSRRSSQMDASPHSPSPGSPLLKPVSFYFKIYTFDGLFVYLFINLLFTN